MTALLYNSGDEIRPGDKVKCADGMVGEVVCVVLLSEGSLLTELSDYFTVRKSDGTEVQYMPSDPSVRLLSHTRPITSKTMNATIEKEKFLQLLGNLDSHTLYYPGPLSKRLADCGLTTDMTPDGQSIILEGQLITTSTPEWGEPGISPLTILEVVYEITIGEPPCSGMNGRGFWYRDVRNKLARFWDLDSKC